MMNINNFYFSFIKKDPKFIPLNIFTATSFVPIINKLRKYKPYCIPFLFPVKKKEAPNYYDIIKHPIDLNSILKKAEREEYSTKNDLILDLKLMNDNCKKYNLNGIIVDYGENLFNFAMKLINEVFDKEITEIKEIKDFCENENVFKKCVIMKEEEIDVENLMEKFILNIFKKYFTNVERKCLKILKDVLVFYLRSKLNK